MADGRFNSSADLIKEIYDQMSGYAAANFGAKNGADFADLARALIETDPFTMKAFMALSLQMLTSAAVLAKMPLGPGAKADAASIRAALRGSVTEGTLLDVFYWGYLFGKRTAEIDALKNLAEKS